MCPTTCFLVIVIIYLLYRIFTRCDKAEDEVVVEEDEEEEEEGFDQDYSTGGDYYEDTKMMALEPGVVSSHKKFVKELNHKTTTASKATVHDSFNPAVPWHGLPRKAMFARLGADRGARVVQSETPEQTMYFSQHNSTKYCL